MARIRELSVAFTADTRGFVRGAKRAKASVSGFSKAVSAAGKFVVSYGAILTSVGAGAMLLFTKRQIDLANTVGDLSKRLGIGTEELSRWAHITSKSGLDTQAFQKSVLMLTRNIGDAVNKTGEALETFKRFGIDAEKLGQLTLTEKMLVLSKAFNELENDTVQASEGVKLFGARGLAMLQVLKEGPQALGKMIEEQERFGVVVTEQGAESATAFNEALIDMKATVTKAGQQLAFEFLNELVQVAQWLRDALPAAIQATRDGFDKLKEVVDHNKIAIMAFKRVLDIVFNPGGVIMDMAKSIAGVKEEINQDGGLFGEMATQGQEDLKTLVDAHKSFADDIIKKQNELFEAVKIANPFAGLDPTASRGNTFKVSQIDVDAFMVEKEELRKHRELLDQIEPARFAVDFDKQTEVFERASNRFSLNLDRLQDKVDFFSEDLAGSFAFAFEDILVEMDNFEDHVKNFLKDVQRLVINTLITQPLQRGLSGFLSNAISGFVPGLATGQPAGFLAGGGAQLAAGVGAEGLIPSGRGAKNALGNNVNINMNVNGVRDANSFLASERQISTAYSRNLSRQTANVLSN